MSAITTSVLDPKRPTLPEWTRWAWASMVEREYWLPLFEKVSRAADAIEWLTVTEGIRPALYTHVSPEQMMQTQARASKHGLVVVPVDQINHNSNSYRSGSPSGKLDLRLPWQYRILVAKQEVVPLILSTPNIAKNNEILGQVLGYPKCCREFFHRTWGAGQVDTTWDQYAETGNATGSVEANLLWRWMGIRWVSHLPCSFQCAETIERGRKTREVAKQHGFVEEAKIIDTVLSWPVEWSGVNGIAELVAPPIKVSTRTDWAPPTDQRRFKRPGTYKKPKETHWTHNGFKTNIGMLTAHQPLLSEIIATVPQNGSIIDLGCGNGRLLRTVKLHRPDITIGGVDVNEDAIQSAKLGLVGKWDASPIENLTWTDWYAPETTVLLHSPIRLEGMSGDQKALTIEAMSRYKTHIVYVYGDNLMIRPLEEWVSMAGFPVDRLIVTCREESKEEVAVGTLEL